MFSMKSKHVDLLIHHRFQVQSLESDSQKFFQNLPRCVKLIIYEKYPPHLLMFLNLQIHYTRHSQFKVFCTKFLVQGCFCEETEQ